MRSRTLEQGAAGTPARERWGAAGAGLIALVVAGAGCAARGPLLDRAIRARGGPLPSFVRTAEADVQAGFPGRWEWRMAFLAPDRYAWSIVTTTGVDHYLFDGTVVRAFVGGREVARDTAPTAPLRTQAAFVAATNLDAARARGTVTPLPASELPPDVATGVAVVMPGGGRYRLGFDARTLLVWATGPFDIPQVGGGELTARFDDYRKVVGRWMPYRTVYELGARRLAVERTLHLCPNDDRLTAAAFEQPDRLPVCDGR